MLTRATLTENIIRSIASLEEILVFPFLPPSLPKYVNWIDSASSRRYVRKKAHERRMNKRVREALKRLEKAKVISYSQSHQKYKLSAEGWIKYLYYHTRFKPSIKGKRLKKNNKKYLVIFDIPEKHRNFRDYLRRCLKNQGAKMQQKSVFLCPSREVYDWTKKVVCNCELDGHVMFIEADRID